jgi:hypothetical protein
VPHFEKATQIKADYPAAAAVGGHGGVNHARKKGGRRTGQVPLQESRTEREVGHPGRIYLDNRLQKPETRPAGPVNASRQNRNGGHWELYINKMHGILF